MIDDLRAMAIFAETVKQGSFKKAADILGLSPSVVSYQISTLEERLGNALLYRSTRKLSLTSEGKILFVHAEKMATEAAEGLGRVLANAPSATGSLTLTVPTSLTRGPLAAKIATFRDHHPDIMLNIIYTDSREDLIEKGIDLAVRVGGLEDSSLMSRHIGAFERKLVCSQPYYESKPAPKHPNDLSAWHWIKHSMLPNNRRLIQNGDSVEVSYESLLSVNSVDAMAQLSILGQGLSTPPALFVNDALESGLLVEVLPDWQVEPIPIYAVWPDNVSKASNARLLIDHLAA